MSTLLFVIIPYFLANPAAHSSWSGIIFPPETVLASEVGVVILLTTGSAMLLLKRRLLPLRVAQAPSQDGRGLRRLPFIALAIAIATAVLLSLSPSFLDFRLRTFEFIAGSLNADEYQIARRLGFADDFIIQDLVGRLRFSLFPVLFVLAFGPFWTHGRIATAALTSIAIFIILAMSFAKLPFVYYLGYSALYVLSASGKTKNMSFITILFVSFGGLLFVILLMSALYTVQYATVTGFAHLFDRPLALSLERIWGESYGVLLRYFHLYPDILEHTGLSSISFIASILDMPFRNVDLEVPYYFFGYGALTSNPAIFIASGYASFGYFGVLLFSIAAFAVVFLLDYVFRLLNHTIVRNCYFAVIGINVTFIAQLALPTALLTYGLGIIPLVFLLVDRAVTQVGTSRPSLAERPK
ncbi:MAG: hypothetical protein WD005_04620 [Haliea sp.]